MKKFKTVADFLKSNPSEEMVEAILEVINRQAIVDLKKEIRDMVSKIRRCERLCGDFEILSLDNKMLMDKIAELNIRIERTKKSLPKEAAKEDKK